MPYLHWGSKELCIINVHCHTLVGGVSGDTDLSDIDPLLSLLLSLLLLLLVGGSGLLTLRFLSASPDILPALSTPPLLSLPLLLGSSLNFFTGGGGLRSGLSLRFLLDCLLSSSGCFREVEGGGAICLCFSLRAGEGL